MSAVEKILLVDEDDANMLFFEVLLQEFEGKTVITAHSGIEALELVEKEKFHFIITAWEMNQMPGTLLVQKIRSDRKRRYTPCMIYSKRMDEDDITLTKELGFENILGMPFDKALAREMISKIIDKEENLDDIEIAVRKIEDFISIDKPTEALKLINPSITKKSPHRARVKTAIGEIWIMVKQYMKSEDILKEALASDPDYIPAKYMMANLYSLMGRHEESITMLEEAAAKSPNNIQTLLKLGSAYTDAENYPKAKECYTIVEGLDPDSSELKDYRGGLAFKEGDLPLAAQLLAETQNGDLLARQFNNMAISYTTESNFEKAIETYNNAINLLEDKTKTHLLVFNMGLAFRKSGDLKSAFNKICQSYIAEPSFEKAYASLAKISKEMKEKEIEIDSDLVKQVKEARQSFKASGA